MNWRKSSSILEAFKSALAGNLSRQSAEQTGDLIEPDFDPRQKKSPITDELGAWRRSSSGVVDSPCFITRRKPQNGGRYFAPLIHPVVRQGPERTRRLAGTCISKAKIGFGAGHRNQGKVCQIERGCPEICSGVERFVPEPEREISAGEGKIRRRRSKFRGRSGKSIAGPQKRP